MSKLYFECKDSYVHDPVNNVIDFTTRRATDYKLNKNVKLPKPMISDKELQCELRRSAYLRTFDEYQGEILKSREEDNRINKNKGRIKHTDTTKERKPVPKTGGKDKSKEKGMQPINLDKDEIEAIKSLKEKIKSGEIMVCQTDKSSRFAALTKEQYLRSGNIHTEKDQEITWKEVRNLQSHVNAHVWWLTHILGYADKTDPSRMLKNLQNHSLEIPEMSLLVKDHKNWSIESGAPVPTRPVVSGNKGVNTHLSEIISEILEPLIMELGGGEISSTEEALHVITETNKSIDRGDTPVVMNIMSKLVEGIMDLLV